MSARSLLRVAAPHFVAGAEVDVAQQITRAAPIIAYMTGWTVFKAMAYCHKKGWAFAWTK